MDHDRESQSDSIDADHVDGLSLGCRDQSDSVGTIGYRGQVSFPSWIVASCPRCNWLTMRQDAGAMPLVSVRVEGDGLHWGLGLSPFEGIV